MISFTFFFLLLNFVITIIFRIIVVAIYNCHYYIFFINFIVDCVYTYPFLENKLVSPMLIIYFILFYFLLLRVLFKWLVFTVAFHSRKEDGASLHLQRQRKYTHIILRVEFEESV